MQNRAPIVLFVYNRPEHTRNNLEKLNAADGADESILCIFSDAAKNQTAEENVNKVRRIIADFSLHSRFKEVKLVLGEKNKGLAQSIIDGVTELMKQYHRVIVLEDDITVSKDFIQYMNDALDHYEQEHSIWAISGYTFPMKALKSYPHDIYLARRGCSWGWATWEDRWVTVDWQVKDYESIKFDLRKRIEFGKWGRDMPFMLDANAYGLNHSWAIRWCYAAYKQDKYTVYPVESRISNNGVDGSGTNYTREDHKYDTVLSEGIKQIKFEMVEPDKRIQKEFRRRHKKMLGIIRDHFWWMLVKRNIIAPIKKRK